MKRLIYLTENTRTHFTFDDTDPNVTIVTTTDNNTTSISIPLQHLEQFIMDYDNVTDHIKFAGLA
jgi:hypothetical protein